MAYTTINNFLTVDYTDVRENSRQRRIELGGLVIITDTEADAMHDASKSAVRKYWQSNVQMDDALTPDADSEVRDTLRLYLKLPDDSVGHFDIPDPHDEVFLSTTGPGANILKDYATLAAALAGTPEKAVADIIDLLLAGTFLISDGETAQTFLSGERVTWR